jgi:hypothetical protein
VRHAQLLEYCCTTSVHEFLLTELPQTLSGGFAFDHTSMFVAENHANRRLRFIASEWCALEDIERESSAASEEIGNDRLQELRDFLVLNPLQDAFDLGPTEH